MVCKRALTWKYIVIKLLAMYSSVLKLNYDSTYEVDVLSEWQAYFDYMPDKILFRINALKFETHFNTLIFLALM